MEKIKVVNIKCGGCEKRIKNVLEKEGFSEVLVDASNQEISFSSGDPQKAREILDSLGYPEASSQKAGSFSKKAKSLVSCAIGRISG